MPCCPMLCHAVQRVRSQCPRPADVVVLPFDLLGSSEALQAAAKAADGAFGAAGVDFLIHNAGEGVGTGAVGWKGSAGLVGLDAHSVMQLGLMQGCVRRPTSMSAVVLLFAGLLSCCRLLQC
jgi:NAD(P)-dependent dehydrogenase (short-subunit alcohol dehydrogenase family)